MIQFILVLICTAFVGIYGWAQIIGSLQQMRKQKHLIITLLLWAALMYAVLYIAMTQHNGLIPCIIGYAISFYFIFKHRNDQLEEK